MTVKGDLDGAVALRDKIKNLETEAVKKTELKADVCGLYNITAVTSLRGNNPGQGPWKIDLVNNMYILSEVGNNFSVKSVTIGTTSYFKWNENDHLITIDTSLMKMSLFESAAREFPSFNITGKKPMWSCQLKK
ncbi:MAG TPA: hypothetical protein VMX55_12285 [candidate division Zixibacteria bacterium]|nr:hypothetical protein [candidate division Zixibacteria bacterium]